VWKDKNDGSTLRTDTFEREILNSSAQIWDDPEWRKNADGSLFRKDCYHPLFHEEWQPFHGNIYYSGGIFGDTYHEGSVDATDLSDFVFELYGEHVNLAGLEAIKHVDSFSLSTSIGEARESLYMFNTTLRRISNLINIVWKKDVIDDLFKVIRGMSIKKLVATGSSGWLEYNFGWSAMIRDFRKFLKSLVDLNQSLNYREEIFRGKTLYTESYVEHPTNANTLSGNSVSNTWERVVAYAVTARASQRWVLNGGVIDPLGVLSLPSTAWELTRMSWVLDYFLNIDNNVALLNPRVGWSYMGASISLTHDLEVTETLERCDTITPGGQIWVIGTPQKRLRRWAIYDRGHTFQSPVPEFNLTANLGFEQVANLFALVGTRWRSVRSSHPVFSSLSLTTRPDLILPQSNAW
jgi:hypothetical protein